VPTERITIKLPAGFDPAKHLKALEKLVADKHGDGWEIDSIDPVAGTAFATRQVAVTEVAAGEKTEARFEVRLPRGTKPSDGARVATKLEDQYEGYVMVEFEPFLGKATLARLTAPEQRCRGAIAVALGVKPWDVQVTARPDAGYDVTLPHTYVPSKHDQKLEEIATVVVGKEGWYVETDPGALKASLVPGEPPSFPPVLSYPFKKTVERVDPKDGDWARVPLGRVLGRTGGEEGPELAIDFVTSPHLQVQGLTGSGKLLRLDTRVPVPVSEQFPDGWATVGTLAVGDTVYAADGTETKIVGFSDDVVEDTYRVQFDTGQVVECGPSHLWLASHHVARVMHAPSATRTTKRGTDRVTAKVERLRRLAHDAHPGAFASAMTIAEMTGMSYSYVLRTLTARGLPTEVISVDVGFERPVNRYLASEAFAALQDHARPSWGAVESAAVQQPPGRWLTARELFSGIGMETPSRNQLRELRGVMKRFLVTTKTVVEHVSGAGSVVAFPLGEAILALAEESERRLPSGMPLERVVSAAEMFETQVYQGQRSNWAVRLPSGVFGQEVELPVPPYVLGAWLGDGHSYGAQITAGSSAACTDKDGITDRERMLGQLSVFDTSVGPNGKTINVRGLKPLLRDAEVLWNKHIPPIYLRAGIDQRLALLQGLMDTDGTVESSGGCELTLSNERLACDALELIRSLGIKASISSAPSSITEDDPDHVGRKRRRMTGIRWRIHFTTSLPVFRLPRKRARLKSETRETTRWLYITKIEKAPPQTMRCLRVAHPSHLVLVEDFVPTHNSVLLMALMTGALARGWQLCIVDAIKGGVDFIDFQPFVRPGGWADNLPAACCVLQMAYEEGQRRKGLIQRAGVQRWTQLPASASLHPMLVVVDELTSLLAPEPTPKGVSKDNPLVLEVAERNLLKASILNTIGKIARELRFAGVSLAIGTQVASTSTGIPTELRANLGAKILLGGKPTDNNRRLALNDPDAVPRVPLHIVNDPGGAARGVGVFEIEGTEPGVAKAYFADPANYGTYLQALGVPTTDQPHPTPAEIARHTPSIDDDDARSGAGGGRPEDPGHSGDRSPSGRLRPEPTRDPATGKVLHGFEKANEQRRQLDAVVRPASQETPSETF
jgi:replicative DNA helicase